MENDLEDKIKNGIFPSVIYKFRLWNDEPNDHILRNRTIKIASPSEMLADYPEAFLPIDEKLITEENLQKYALHTAQLKFPEQHISYQKMVAKQLRSKMKIEDITHRNRWETRAKKRNDETLGIFCASTTCEDLYLWENFADLGKGFTVGLDTRKIVLHPDIYGSAGLVDYYPNGNPPKVPPFSFSEKELYDKSMKEIFSIPKKYEQEKEFRVGRTNRKRGSDGRIAQYTEEDRIINLKPECYKEIILGYDISDGDQKDIFYYRDKYLDTVPIFSSKIENGKVVKVKKY